MRKLGLSVLAISIILLMVSPSFAQTPRQPTSSEGKTGFTNIAVRGLNATGVPGYIELTAEDGQVHYLWVDDNSTLKIASDIAVGAVASPQLTDWNVSSFGSAVPGIVVGTQTKP